MNTLKLIIILMCYECFASDEKPYCFKFTWPGSRFYNNTANFNCTGGSYIGVPCVEPMIDDEWIYPNTTKMYLEHKDDNKNAKDSYLCPLQKGLTCIKYTNTFNNAIIFASHYCGRVLEDKETPISSGCYNYEVNGHIIEVCACQSIPGQEPCNIAIKQIASILILFPSMIILFYYFYNV
ncbi:PREDICTED: uncharacterized protein LOC107072123 [Polistes dominula]|uniref:Uncharacterized protein LOC107072123 n=1 Tax=Polistes dominula TaxID=743375 RepID=A0ABM1J496_POLDO|nr:PREDICTED: uncharacterized protein LOC107072123 [Polistes dominula]